MKIMSLDIQKLKSLKNKKNSFFRFKKLDKDTYLITNDIWKYSFLSVQEFNNFLLWKIDSWKKYKELLKNKFIKNKTYKQDMSLYYAKKNHFLAYGPSLHIIVTTLRCNHKCKYCHAAAAPISAKKFDMTKETAKKIVDTIFYTSNPDIIIEFQGWESLINWNILQYIVEYASIKAIHLKKNLKFSLVTNLTIMDDNKLNYLLENNISISTSLDWDEETHNYNRTYKKWNSFKEVTYWIKKINNKYKKEKKDFKVWALLTTTKKTLKKYKEIIDTYIDLWLDSIFLRPLNPYGFAEKDIQALSYSKEEFVDFYKKSLDYIIELNKKWIIFRENLSQIYLSKILTETDPNYLDERSPCWACIWQVAYNYDWKIYSCDEWRMLGRMWDDSFLMAEIKESWEETYRDMIDSETTKIMVQASTLDWLPWYNDSVYKPYIWVCPIYSYKTNNNIIPNFSKDDKKFIDYKILDYLFLKLREKEIKKIFQKWIENNLNHTVSQCENI